MPQSKMKISDLFIVLSQALDMNNTSLLSHSRRVAYMALELGKELQLDKNELNRLVLVALIHDIGIKNADNKFESLNNFELNRNLVEKHCRLGFNLTRKLGILPEIEDIVLYHHHKWEGNNFNSVKKDEIPLASRIIYLADRIDALINYEEYILFQVDSIKQQIKSRAGIYFDPELVKKFIYLSRKESFWLNISSGEFNVVLNKWGRETHTELTLKNLEEVSSMIAEIIDRISPFTSRHSSGVATIAAMLTHEMGYSIRKQRVIRIAGLIHDLGKLMIPQEILEKDGDLTDNEYKIVQQHSFYTYKLLNDIKGLGNISQLAAYHHEKLDGSGYPFHLSGSRLNIGSRIIAVSDIFQALTEERPYRSAFTAEEAVEILQDMKSSNKLDPEIISVLTDII